MFPMVWYAFDNFDDLSDVVEECITELTRLKKTQIKKKHNHCGFFIVSFYRFFHGIYRDLYIYHGYPWYIYRDLYIYTMDIHGIYRDLYIYHGKIGKTTQ